MPGSDWSESLLDGLRASEVEIIPFVPDGVIAPLLRRAAELEFTMVSLAREEEGVGVLSGAYLAGRRGLLLMQSSGMGNSLNVIGSLAMAQRIPLPMIVTERGGLGEQVATQIPFGGSMKRILETMGIGVFEVSRADEVRDTICDAVAMSYVSRVPSVTVLKAALSRKESA